MIKKNWRTVLTPEQFQVLREKGTEAPFSGQYTLNFEKGKYYCVACGQELFDSKTKFNAGCGWPSFYDVINTQNILLELDQSFEQSRLEVLCANCGSHLGHVFDDGPKPTNKRYCINSIALHFKKYDRD